MPGGRQVAGPDHDPKHAANGQASRWPANASGLLSPVVCTSAVIPVAAVSAALPAWIAALVVSLLALGGVLVTAIAAVIPQKSEDRLRWWREWLGHRERMASRRDRVSPPAQPGGPTYILGESSQLPAPVVSQEGQALGATPDSRSAQPCATPASEELVPE